MYLKVLIPDVNKRIDAWVRIMERKKQEEARLEETSSITITLSREYGCEAYPLAKELQDYLEKKTQKKWLVLDKSLLDHVAKDTHLSKSLIKDMGLSSTFFRDIFSSFKRGAISKHQVFTQITEIIYRVAEAGNAIIIGRGGAIITQDLDNCYHFRLEAPLGYRIDSIVDRANISRDEAERVVQENQQKREKFLEDFLHSDVSNPKNYDAVFNNSRVSLEDIKTCILTITGL
jgi:cytidylate kinase